MTHKFREYSQWFLGTNQVADALGCDMDRTDNKLTQVLIIHIPSQVPSSFKIVPLPNKIISWLTSLLQQLPVNLQFNEAHMTTTLGRGKDGSPTAIPQDSHEMCSSLISQNSNESTLLAVLPWLSMRGNFCDQVMLPWLL